MAVTTRELVFPNARGESLSGRLELPDGEPRAWAIFAHCFTCSKNIAAASRISRALRDRRIAVLRFDFTGLGNSEGDFANTDFSSNVEDLVAAADYLREHHRAPQLLIGHSLGGAAVLVAADRVPEAVAVVTIAAPSDTDHLRETLLTRAPGIEKSGQALVSIGGREFPIRRRFLEDLEQHRLAEAVGRLSPALLVFHSPTDAVVDVGHAERILAAAPWPRSFIALDGADHLLSRTEDAEFVAGVLCAWVTRYIGATD